MATKVYQSGTAFLSVLITDVKVYQSGVAFLVQNVKRKTVLNYEPTQLNSRSALPRLPVLR